MLVQDVMTPAVTMIDVDATVREAARLMSEHDIGFLPATMEKVCVGVITDRDIVTRVIAEGLDPEKTHVAEVMSRGVRDASRESMSANEAIASVSRDSTLDEAARLMDQLHVERLAVHDRDLQMVGVLSRRDLPLAVAGQTLEAHSA